MNLRKQRAKYHWDVFIDNSPFFNKIEEYTDSKTTLWVECTVCGLDFKASPSHIINGFRDCPGCRGVSPDAAFNRLQRELMWNNIKLESDYINSKTPVLLLHKSCGQSTWVTPNNYLDKRYNRGNCKSCGRSITSLMKSLKKKEFEPEIVWNHLCKRGYVWKFNSLRTEMIMNHGFYPKENYLFDFKENYLFDL